MNKQNALEIVGLALALAGFMTFFFVVMVAAA